MSCGKRNMFQTIACECDLQLLAKVIKKAGLKQAIACTDPITVFGPKNKPLCKYLKAHPEIGLTEILTYHVVNRYLKTRDLVDNMKYPTLSGKDVRANVYSGPTFNNVTTINGVPLCEKNIKASNGVLHKIDKVLVPPAGTMAEIAIANPNFSILVQAVLAANPAVLAALSDPAANLTLFAPTNEAFVALSVELKLSLEQILALPQLTNILLYHVIGQPVFSVAIREGKTKNIPTLDAKQTITLNKWCRDISITDANNRVSNVIGADVLAVNGVIHVIDKVLLPK